MTAKLIPIALVLSVLSIGACSSQPPKPKPAEPTPPAKSPAPTPPVSVAPTPTPPPPPPAKADPEPPRVASGLRELFPHIRADLAAKFVEFDGTIPIDCHDPKTPRVYLEVTVCTPDTKEHETLVVTPAKPSHIHAALLAAGYKPGAPGSWKWDEKKLTAVPPSGDALAITIAYRDKTGKEVEAPATSWIINADSGARFNAGKQDGFVFAGSGIVKRQGREMYDADGSGLLIGLTTFGSESIAWRDVISPEAEVAEPEWIADPKVVPPVGTPVIVRIRPGSR